MNYSRARGGGGWSGGQGGRNSQLQGGYGGGSYIAESSFDVARQVSSKEGDGHVIIQLVSESDGLFS